MSPLRTYRCEAGHEFDQYESMYEAPRKHCETQVAWRGETPVLCMKAVERVMQPVNAIVKGGTPKYHRGKA